MGRNRSDESERETGRLDLCGEVVWCGKARSEKRLVATSVRMEYTRLRSRLVMERMVAMGGCCKDRASL